MQNNLKTISVVTSCLNEEGNIEELYRRVVGVLKSFPQYRYELLFVDNFSTDGTRSILRLLAAEDTNLKVFFNSRNFGPICSGHNAFLHASGDAVVLMCSDLQDPPELISNMILKWEEGYRVVVAVKSSSNENGPLYYFRKAFYRGLSFLSDTDHIIQNFTGFGLYDRAFMNQLTRFRDPVPYLRGFVSEIGLRRAEILFVQPERKWGKSKHSLLSLYDFAISGIINHSKLPLKLATFVGFFLAGISMLVAAAYFIYKLLYWNTFTLGVAPLIIGVFFFSAVQLIFIGIIGEYVGAILTQVKNRPLAIIEETINCPNPDA